MPFDSHAHLRTEESWDSLRRSTRVDFVSSCGVCSTSWDSITAGSEAARLARVVRDGRPCAVLCCVPWTGGGFCLAPPAGAHIGRKKSFRLIASRGT